MFRQTLFLVFVCSLQFIMAVDLNLFFKPPVKPINKNLVNTTSSIIENVFLKQFATYNLISAVKNPKDSYFVDFKESLLQLNNGYSIYRLDNHTKIQKIAFRLKIYNVVLLDSYETFEILVRNITLDLFDFRGHFLFVLIHGAIVELHKIFQAMYLKKIYNTNAIYAGKGGEIRIKSFLPFQADKCGDTTPRTWKIIDGTFEGDWNSLLPNKTKNLHGCTIRIVTLHRCPATCVSTKMKLVDEGNGTSLRNVTQIDGFEINILRTIAKSLNFKMDRKVLYGMDQAGTVSENGTATGALKCLLNNESDIALGGFALRQTHTKFLDPSMVYFSMPIVFAIPPGKKYSGFEKLLRPFDLLVWFSITSTLTIGILVIILMNYKFKGCRSFVFGRRTGNPVVNMLIAIFAQTQRRLPGRNFSRFLLMSFLLFCLVQRNVYQGSLYIFLRSDGRHKEVQSIPEMIEKDFQFYMYSAPAAIIKENYTEIYKRFVPVIADLKAFLKSTQSFRTIVMKSEADNIFYRPLEDGVKAALLTNVNDVMYRNQKTYKNFTMKVCKQELITTNTVMYFQKSFFLKEAIDSMLDELLTAGIVSYWINKFADKRFLNWQDPDVKSNFLQMQHLHGVFHMGFIGLGIAVAVFIFEVMIERFKKKRKQRCKKLTFQQGLKPREFLKALPDNVRA